MPSVLAINVFLPLDDGPISKGPGGARHGAAGVKLLTRNQRKGERPMNPSKILRIIATVCFVVSLFVPAPVLLVPLGRRAVDV